MEKPEVKGTVTPLSSIFPMEEAQKAAKRVEEALSEKHSELNQLREFIADNTSLINLVQKLPDELHHDVPFGKAAFFPGRLIHTNEFLVLVGENYYVERTAKQTVDILKRRGKSLESKVDSLKAVMQDLKLEASFFDSTAAEAAEGLVEIREYEEENSAESASQSGTLEQDISGFTEADNTMDVPEDDDFARLMSKLDELEKEELAAESYEENDEDQVTNTVERVDDEVEQIKTVSERNQDEGFSFLSHDERHSEVYQSRKPVQQSIDKEPMKVEMSNKHHHEDIPNPLACTGLTVEPVTKGEISHSQSMPQDTKMLNPSINSSKPEKKVRFQVEDSSRKEKSAQTSRSGFDSSKAFTGSIVEHSHNLENLPGQTMASAQQDSVSQPSKPVSRFKMQRK
ncbi:Prefoldin subunit [Corchorus olitorius]|uniref:Prefoldin subunit n=1 Tax=Corchorus olitorius TaxID=93759 RepID=A0A1R3KPE9_9ROSI|nr:Prefoldin subunit [Corchorus olitorius]